MPTLTLTALVLASGLPDSITHSQIDALSADTYWRQLIHYEDQFFGAESRADGAAFFLSPEGKVDPRAELRATLEAFFAGAPKDSAARHAQCQFPLRLQWLDSHLDLTSLGLPAQECPELADFLSAIQPGKAHLIFASAYLNAPASAFGHTFLRIEHRAHPGNALLATMVNFAAYPTTLNPFLYTVMGLLGGFPGKFAAFPYYVKVQEYSNLDSRDLWEYELTLTQDEVERMILHVWELDTTYFDYFFFTENCSYLLLELLDLARPSLQLAAQYDNVVIPSDTLKTIVETEGLVRNRVYRPAHAAEMNARRAQLNGDEVDVAESLVGDEPRWEELDRLPKERRARILDAAFDLLKYEGGFHPNQDQDFAASPSGKREMELLRRRGALAMTLEEISPPEPRAPEGSHGSARFGVAGGINRAGRAFQILSFRPSLHDGLDLQTGYVRDSTVEMGALELRLEPIRLENERQRNDALVLERLDLIRIESLLPWTGWVRSVSWRARLGAGWVEDTNCRRWKCQAADLSAGPGLAWHLRWLGAQTFYLFTSARTFAGPAFDVGYRVGAGASAGTYWTLVEGLRLHFEGAYRWDFLGDRALGERYWALRGGLGIAPTSWFSTRVEAKSVRDLREARATLFFYF